MNFLFISKSGRFNLKFLAISMVLLEPFVWGNTLLMKVSKGSISTQQHIDQNVSPLFDTISRVIASISIFSTFKLGLVLKSNVL